MRKKSLRITLTAYSATIILTIIISFSAIALIYLAYFSQIIQKIYGMDDDFIMPILKVLIVLFGLLIIFALFVSIVSSLNISNRFLKTIQGFIDNIKHIKQDGLTNRIEINGKDELSKLGEEFNTLMDQVEGNMKQQNQFISDASHELKTPLAILKGNLDMLERWGKEDPEVLSNALQVSNNEVSRLIALCEELLQLTRHEELDYESILVNEIIQDTCNSMQSLHPTFTISCIVDDSQVAMKTEHMKQLCLIFLDNAIKYAKEDHYQIEVLLQNNVLSFKDYGVGIAKEHQQLIFDRFYKIEESREAQPNSFGLGLSIAKRLCDRYGFDLSVEGEVQNYSIFKIDMNKKEDIS